MELLKAIGYFAILPGFLFTAVIGLVASWIDRKVTARVQWRKGPPLLQPFYDIVKLTGKETIVPQGASKMTFLLSPLFGLAAVTIVSTLLLRAIGSPKISFLGDLIVILYLFTIPSLAVIMGAFASRNPLASLGASREMKLILAYELPFVLAALIPVINARSIRIGEILAYQLNNGITLGSLSGIIGFLVAILCMQAKLALVPFDAAEAETEIMGGTYIEYSGVPLAVFKLTRAMMLFVLPMFLVALFMGGIIFSGWHVLWGILKYVLLLVIIVLIRNTAPRVRIDQAMKFFWGPMTALAALGVLFALLGV